jgi:hypothetical protein
MGKRLLILIASLATALAVASPAGAGTGGRPLSTTLSGAEEIPGPGDLDATGQADLRLNQGKGRICFDLSWTGIDGQVFAGHIHNAPAGVAGPIVVPLFTGSFAGTDSISDCIEGVDRGLIKAIRKDPTDYYVNFHSLPSFPNGAVRGQLGD